jgi:hypothetical protein
LIAAISGIVGASILFTRMERKRESYMPILMRPAAKACIAAGP